MLTIKQLKVYFPIRQGIIKRKVGDIKAVDGIDLAISPGQTLALVGESGSGKTTTAKAIVKLIKKTAGIPDITIPFWLFCILISLPFAYLIVINYKNKIKTVANKSFGVQREIIDGKAYVNCEFDGTELVFRGTQVFKFEFIKSKSMPRFSFEGNAANAISALIGFYSVPALRPIVDDTFANIKREGLAIEDSRKGK